MCSVEASLALARWANALIAAALQLAREPAKDIDAAAADALTRRTLAVADPASARLFVVAVLVALAAAPR